MLCVSPRQRSPAEQQAIRELKRALRGMVQEGRRDAALRRLSRRDARELLDPVEFADQRGKLALAFFVGGEDREALRPARASAREAGDLLPRPDERREGKEGVRTCRSRWSPCH